jgi:hypothetical protein
MAMEESCLHANDASIDDKVEESTLLLFWGSQIARAQAEMKAAKRRCDISTHNYIATLKRFKKL